MRPVVSSLKNIIRTKINYTILISDHNYFRLSPLHYDKNLTFLKLFTINVFGTKFMRIENLPNQFKENFKRKTKI